MTSERYRGGILLPGEASTALSVVAFLFISSGTLLLLLVTIVAAGKLFQWSAVESITPAPWELVRTGAFAIAYCWIGALLHKAKRLGAVLALAVAGLQVLAVVLSPAVTLGGVLKPALMALAVVLAWPHLSRDGRNLEAATSIAPRAR